MLKIRLRRIGAIRQPHYRIVVADARAPRDGRYFEILGHYNPRTEPATIQVDVAKYEEWKSKGAQPTEAVARLVRQYNRAVRAGTLQPTGGKTTQRPVSTTEPAPAPEAEVAESPQAEATDEATAPVLETATETPVGALEGATDTDTAV